MKKLRIFALLLILALAFSTFAACDIIGGTTDTPDVGGGTTDDENKNPDNNQNGGTTDDTQNGGGDTTDGCEHYWVSGACSKCQEVCSHNWVSGTCGICDSDCNHQWQSGVCTVCGVDCTHLWGEGGLCVNCGDSCEHNWKNGECTVCHKPCQHVWADGVCTVCNKACQHDFDPSNDYTCTICGEQAWVPPECKHSWKDGTCVHCGNECEHKWDNGYCPVCTVKCEHQFDGDTCTVCGFKETVTPPETECKHNWQDGYCDKCGNTCDHRFKDGVCGNCGKVCEHYFSMGACINCGLLCEHEWSGSHCEKCGLDCHHDTWRDGFCAECNYECAHQWTLEKCDLCGLVCNHTFEGASCTKCGYTSGGIDNPIEVIYEDMSFFVPYSATFYDLISLYIGVDCEESLTRGYWAVDNNGELIAITDVYSGICEYGRYVKVVFVEDSHGYPDECNHEWQDGYCPLCGTACAHIFDGNFCMICGFEGGVMLMVIYDGNEYLVRYESTLEEFISEHLSTTYADTVSNGGYWTVDDIFGGVQTIYADTYLNNFAMIVNLQLVSGGDIPPSECHHPSYNHEGVCDLCGYVCPHKWDHDYCQLCGNTCYHEKWENSFCVNCKKECDHSWTPGSCNVCGKVCEHQFFENSCMICGYYEENGESGYFSLSIQAAAGSEEIARYNVKIDETLTVYDLLTRYLETDNGESVYIGYEESYLIRYNGTALDEKEWMYLTVESGSDIFIYRCYIYEIEYTVNGETSFELYKFPAKLGGNDILGAVGLSVDDNSFISVDGMNYDAYTFGNTVFPLDGNDRCFIRYEALATKEGNVRLEVYYDGYYNIYHEAAGVLFLGDYFTAEELNSFIIALEMPDGSVVDVTSFDMMLNYDPNYVSYDDYYQPYTAYKIYFNMDVFFVDLTIDDQYYGSMQFRKSAGVTLRDIFDVFGVNVVFENYTWHFNFTHSGTGDLTLDSVISEDVNIYAYDTLPRLTLNVDGKDYKLYHESSLTLIEAIELVNAQYGTSFAFEGYCWYAQFGIYAPFELVKDPYVTVINAGETAYVSGKTLNEVTVYFDSDFGPISEDGMMDGVAFKKGDKWIAPEFGSHLTGMLPHFAYFTGEFEYRVTGSDWEVVERYDVNSIEELFALNLPEVTLYAKVEIDYEKLNGIYDNGSYIFVVEEGYLSYFEYGYNNIVTNVSYTVEVVAYEVRLVCDNGYSFHAPYFEEYYKLGDDQSIILIFYDGYCSDVLRSEYELYERIETDNLSLDMITNIYGEGAEEIYAGNVYLAYVSEKPYEYPEE